MNNSNEPMEASFNFMQKMQNAEEIPNISDLNASYSQNAGMIIPIIPTL